MISEICRDATASRCGESGVLLSAASGWFSLFTEERRMKLGILGRMWALLGAALLLGVGQLAAAPAQAQTCNEEEELVWELVDALGYALVTIDNAYNTDPSQRDCTRVCKKLTNGCKRMGQSFARDANTLIRTGLSAAAILCKTADDRRLCKSDIKGARQLARLLMRDLKADFKNLCADPVLAASCSDACNDGDYPGCCEEAFGATCP
jgi:hypothetical protein